MMKMYAYCVDSQVGWVMEISREAAIETIVAMLGEYARNIVRIRECNIDVNTLGIDTNYGRACSFTWKN